MIAAVRETGSGVSGGTPHLSLVLACYNEAEHLRASFAEIRDTLEQTGWPFEVIFVDDVSRDGTPRDPARDRGRPPAARPPGDPARDEPRPRRDRRPTASAPRGARSPGYLDVDLEVHCRYIPSLVRAIEKGADVATVRRIYAFQLRSLDRYFMSRGYSFLVRRLLGVPFHDTETGYKFFRRERVLPLLDEIEDAGLVLGHGVHGARAPARAARSSRCRGPTSGARTRPRRSGACATRSATSSRCSASAGRLQAEGAVKALGEIGWRRAARFGFFTLAMVPYRLALFPQLRAPWLRLLGARIGRRTVLHDVRFFNLYRRGPRRARDRRRVLRRATSASSTSPRASAWSEQVTLAERVLVLTHTNVGYRDHPLQARFPAMAAPVVIERGAFLGANVTVLPGVRDRGAVVRRRRQRGHGMTCRRARSWPECPPALAGDRLRQGPARCGEAARRDVARRGARRALAASCPSCAALVPGRQLLLPRPLAASSSPCAASRSRACAPGELRFWNPYVHEGVAPLPPAARLPARPAPAPRAPTRRASPCSWPSTSPSPPSLFFALARGPRAGPPRGRGRRRSSTPSAGSCSRRLNLYVYVAGRWPGRRSSSSALRRARAGAAAGRSPLRRPCVAASALSTTGVEIVAQAIVVGARARPGPPARGAAGRRRCRARPRAGARGALVLGAGLRPRGRAAPGDAGFPTDGRARPLGPPRSRSSRPSWPGSTATPRNLADRWWGSELLPAWLPLRPEPLPRATAPWPSRRRASRRGELASPVGWSARRPRSRRVARPLGRARAARRRAARPARSSASR